MPQTHHIGDFAITTVQDHPSPSRNPLTVYPTVPASAWDPYRSFALEADGSYRSQWRGHLIKSPGKNGALVLVDTGMGPGPHAHTGKAGELLNSLSALGVRREDITAVVTTHTHGDHIGWNVTWESGKPRPTFPKATYFVAADDFEHYSKVNPANDAFDRHVRPLREIAKLVLVRGVVEVAPGVTTLPTNGHTPGHQCVLVSSKGEYGVLTGDLFHNMAQVSEPQWCPSFDWNTDLSTASRRWLLWRARAENWVVFSGHLPDGRSIGRVVEKDGKSAWQPV